MGGNRGKYEICRDILENSSKPSTMPEILAGNIGYGSGSELVKNVLVPSGLLDVTTGPGERRKLTKYVCTEKGREYLKVMYDIEGLFNR